jgi:hypothetical protein
MADLELKSGFDWSATRAGLEEMRAFANNATRNIQSDIKNVFSAGSLAGALTLGAIEEGIRRTVEYGNKVYELGKRFAVSTDTIQQFGNVAEKSGSSLEGVAMGFNRLDIASSKALGGNQEIVKSFNNLGVTVEDLKQLTPEQIMLKIGSSSMNAADMVKILGRNGTELRETLRKLADGSEELSDAIGVKQINALHRADEAWKTWSQNVRVYTADLIGNVIQGWQFFFAWFDQQFGGSDKKMKELAASQRKSELESMMTPEGQAAMHGGGAHAGSATSGDLEEAIRRGTGGGRGSGGGASGADTTADRIAKLEEEHALRMMSDQEKLNALIEKQKALVFDLVKAGNDEELKQQALLHLAENQNAIDKQSDTIWKDELEKRARITEERERAGAKADKELAQSRETNKELQLELQGRSDLAERAKIQFDYDQKIADAQAELDDALDRAKEAREAGNVEEAKANEAVANQNKQLIEQLSIEKQNALAAHDKSVEEEKAAKAIQDQLAADKERKQVDQAGAELEKLREQRRERELIASGLTQQAEQLRINLEYEEKIRALEDKEKELQDKINEAYADGNTELAEQLQKHREILQAEEAELANEKEQAEQEAYNASVLAGLQRLEGGLSSQSGDTLLRSGEGYAAYLEARQRFLQGGGDLSQWSGLNTAFERLISEDTFRRQLADILKGLGDASIPASERMRRLMEVIQQVQALINPSRSAADVQYLAGIVNNLRGELSSLQDALGITGDSAQNTGNSANEAASALDNLTNSLNRLGQSAGGSGSGGGSGGGTPGGFGGPAQGYGPFGGEYSSQVQQFLNIIAAGVTQQVTDAFGHTAPIDSGRALAALARDGINLTTDMVQQLQQGIISPTDVLRYFFPPGSPTAQFLNLYQAGGPGQPVYTPAPPQGAPPNATPEDLAAIRTLVNPGDRVTLSSGWIAIRQANGAVIVVPVASGPVLTYPHAGTPGAPPGGGGDSSDGPPPAWVPRPGPTTPDSVDIAPGQREILSDPLIAPGIIGGANVPLIPVSDNNAVVQLSKQVDLLRDTVTALKEIVKNTTPIPGGHG